MMGYLEKYDADGNLLNIENMKKEKHHINTKNQDHSVEFQFLKIFKIRRAYSYKNHEITKRFLLKFTCFSWFLISIFDYEICGGNKTEKNQKPKQSYSKKVMFFCSSSLSKSRERNSFRSEK